MRRTRSPLSTSLRCVSRIGRPAPTVASKRMRRPRAAAASSSRAWLAALPGERLLVREHQVEAVAERRAAADRPSPRRSRPPAPAATPRARRCRPAPRGRRRGGRPAPPAACPGPCPRPAAAAGGARGRSGRRRSPSGRARPTTRSGRGRRPASRSASARAHAAEAEQHHVGARRPASGRRRSWRAGTPRGCGAPPPRPRPSHDERDVALRGALGDRDHVDASPPRAP